MLFLEESDEAPGEFYFFLYRVEDIVGVGKAEGEEEKDLFDFVLAFGMASHVRHGDVFHEMIVNQMIPELMGRQFVLTYEFQLLFLVQIVLHGIPVNQAEADNGENGKVAKCDSPPSTHFIVTDRCCVYIRCESRWNPIQYSPNDKMIFGHDDDSCYQHCDPEESSQLVFPVKQLVGDKIKKVYPCGNQEKRVMFMPLVGKIPPTRVDSPNYVETFPHDGLEPDLRKGVVCYKTAQVFEPCGFAFCKMRLEDLLLFHL